MKRSRGDVVGAGLAREGVTADREILLIAVISAIFARAALGYDAFPAVDDFAYAPLAQAWMEPGLFARDDALQSFSNHALIYRLLYALFQGTMGPAAGFFGVTLLLTVATSFGILGLMRCFRVRGFALLLVFALSVVVQVRGIGRGEYGGILGDAVHMQWLGSCLLLFTFRAFLTDRTIQAGMLLGLAALAHPMVALHGAFVVLCGLLAQQPFDLRRAVKIAAIALLLALPMEVHVWMDRGGSSVPSGVPVSQLIDEVYRFRAPHHYALTGSALGLLGLYVVLGIGSFFLLRQTGQERLRGAAGLFVGLVVLFLATALFYAKGISWVGRSASVWPYILDFSRTTPLLMVYAAVLFSCGLERLLIRNQGVWSLKLSPAGYLACVAAIAVLLINGRGWFIVLGGLSLAAGAILSRPLPLARRAILGSAGLSGALVLVTFLGYARKEAPVPGPDAQLFGWVRSETARDSLFIVPPSYYGFRYYAKRSVFADFKLVSVAQPAQGWLVRKRLELIAAPDADALAAQGWPGVPLWDQSYARNNDFSRIAWLLDRLDADYFLRDLRRAPLSDGDSPPDKAGLRMVFRNERYAIFTRSPAGG